MCNVDCWMYVAVHDVGVWGFGLGLNLSLFGLGAEEFERVSGFKCTGSKRF